MDLYRLLWWIILAVSTVILLVLAVTVSRRGYKNFWFRRLDRERERAEKEIRANLDTDDVRRLARSLKARPRTARWVAVEEALLRSFPSGEDPARPGRERVLRNLFHRAGYVGYYEKRLSRGSAVRRAEAADRLGKMCSRTSAARIAPLLADRNPEVVAVAVRALSRLRTRDALLAILDHLPGLLSEPRITRKTAVTCLLSFGADSMPELVEKLGTPLPPPAASCLLEALCNYPDKDGIAAAMAHLSHPDPEVRAKAVRLAGSGKGFLGGSDAEKVLPLLDDSAWFVRLQAAKAVGNLELESGIPLLGRRLKDENWQVRNAAAIGLTKFGTRSIGQFFEALRDTDRYAKESVCEEIGKTGFAGVLFETLGSGDPEAADRAGSVLAVMSGLGFSAPLQEYLETAPEGGTKEKLLSILSAEASP